MSAQIAAGEFTPEPTRRKIRWFVVLAGLLAAALASAVGVLLGDEVLSRETLERSAPPYEVVFEYSLAAGIALGAALLVWLAFYVLLFRKRARLWRSVLALGLMIVFALMIGVPVRIGALLAHILEDEETVRVHQTQGMERRRALRASMAPDIDGLRMDQGMPAMHSVAELRAHQQRIDAALVQFRAYRAAVMTDMENSLAELDRLDIHPNEREKGRAYYQERMAATSNTQRHLELTERILDGGSQLLTYFIDHRSGWIIEDGSLVMIDRSIFEEARRRGQELDDLGAQLDNVQGAMGMGLDGSRLLGEDVDAGAASGQR